MNKNIFIGPHTQEKEIFFVYLLEIWIIAAFRRTLIQILSLNSVVA
jgi:hypothetical protein